MRTWIPLAGVLLIATCASAQAQEEETVTIRAEGVPIGTLLAVLAQRHRLERVTIQPEVQQHPVWIALDRVPLRTALARILEASGLDFAIAGRRVIVGQWTTMARAATARAVAEAEAELQAISAAATDESTILPTASVGFVANGENITYQDPKFVPYKMRPEVRALRMAIDVAKIP